tara:strand:- start:410 stop:592 length:183 start_codon:yes stop_codon:yes gene_type:complete
MSLREKLPDDIDELKDIVEIQLEEIKSLKSRNKVNQLYSSPYHISLSFKPKKTKKPRKET